MQSEESNSMGVAGFVIALIGFLTCGFLSPIGLIFSMIGLMSRPRGLAIAGTVLGSIGSLWLIFAGFTMVAAFFGLAEGLKSAGQAMDKAAKKMEQELEAKKLEQRKEIESIRKSTNTTSQTPQKSNFVIKTKTAPVTEKPEPQLESFDEVSKVATTPIPPVEIAAQPEAETPKDFSTSPLNRESDRIEKEWTRTWRSSNNSFSVKARLVSFDGTIAKLWNVDEKRELDVPMNKLSSIDQQWLKRQVKTGTLSSDGIPVPLMSPAK